MGSFSRRILGVLSLVLTVALLGSALGAWSLNRVSQETELMVKHALATERLTVELQRHLTVNLARSKALALSSEPQVGDVLSPEIQKTAAQVEVLLKKLEAMQTSAEDKLMLGTMTQTNREFLKALQELSAARDGGVTANIEKVYSERLQPTAQAVQQAVTQLGDAQRAEIDQSAQQIESLSLTARWGLVLFGACAAVLGALLSFWLVRAITGPIRQAVDTANRVAALDLTQTIVGHDRDEGGQLLHALARMQASLHQLVGQTQLASGSVAEGAAEIAAGNMDFSNRTELAASFLQQTAALVEQIARAMSDSLQASARGEQLARSAATQAEGGSAIVGDLMQTMTDIRESSRQIVDITAVIDGIAFQTNILALNAAVEAARAGNEGRGFAVVAAEVRVLANRSGAAARQIKALIGNSVEKVELGSGKAVQARAAMMQIVESVQRVAQAIGSLNADTLGQSASMSSIHAAVNQLDRMTQQNSAVIEESSAAAQTLQERASDLRDMTGKFRMPNMALALA
jgi:methyl-accepting chemotaxis protein